jgi:hypothetical protein
MTIHGAGFGLDEGEAALAQIAGYLDALEAGDVPPGLARISIVERNARRAERLAEAMAEFLHKYERHEGQYLLRAAAKSTEPPRILREAGTGASTRKPFAFVSMNDAPDYDDVYYYAIQSAVHAHGLLCVRLDAAPDDEADDVAGDLLAQMRARVETAACLIADLTDAPLDTLLTIGYAWGARCPVVLIARHDAALPAPLAAADVLRYQRLRELEQALETRLRAYHASSPQSEA